MYRCGFEELINEKINLKLYDQKLENSKLFLDLPKWQTRERKNNSVLQTDYFSILNPFYIEKLSQEDINWLKEKKVADQEVLQLIERTYKDILKKRV